MVPDRAERKRCARELLKTAQVSPLKMTALYCGCTLLLNLLGSLPDALPAADSASWLEPLSLFASIFTSLAGWILAAGFTLYCMGIRRREVTEAGTLFDGFSFTGKIVTLNIVMDVFVFLWSMLFAIPGVIAFYRYRFALYNLYEDPELNILDALEMSKRQTCGMKLDLLKLDLSYLGWVLLGMLPALLVDGRVYYQALIGDPSAILSSGPSLLSILLCGLWSLAVALFYLPNYQCVMLDYFDAARAQAPNALPRGNDFDAFDR